MQKKAAKNITRYDDLAMIQICVSDLFMGQVQGERLSLKFAMASCFHVKVLG